MREVSVLRTPLQACSLPPSQRTKGWSVTRQPSCALHAQDREKERERELIKQQYLGTDKVRKKILKPSEKFRFNFDWEANDDTSRDLNPLYNSTHEAALLFGRGLRAGVDRREQMKAAASHQKELLRKMRESTVRLPRVRNGADLPWPGSGCLGTCHGTETQACRDRGCNGEVQETRRAAEL